MRELFLVAGLGNPGRTYAGNRHNVGFMVVDLLAARIGGRFTSHRSRCDVLDGRLGEVRVVLAKPRSYMNSSGGPVRAVTDYFTVPPERLVVVHDELDLPYGTLRLKFGGGDNGHNGLRSISSTLGTRDYYRVRFGIGRPPGRQEPTNFVLRDFASVERRDLPVYLERAADAVQALLTRGLVPAQNAYHGA